MGTGAVQGHSEEYRDSTSSQPSQAEAMSCETCSINFTLFKRKKICFECKRQFCSTCLPKEANRPSNRRKCPKCHFLLSGNFNRNDLMQLKIKDLCLFLNRCNISTNTCIEKHDLVELVLMHSRNDVYRIEQENNRQRLEELTQRQRQNRLEAESTTTSLNPYFANDGSNDHDLVTAGTHNGDSLGQDEDVAEENYIGDEKESPKEPSIRRIKLHDVTSLEDIDELTVRQLKEILVCNFVDYRGCCERWELECRVRKLWCEKEKNREKAKSDICSEEMCKICMDSVIDSVLLECGHMITCTECGKRLAECPICRQYVVRVVHIFKT